MKVSGKRTRVAVAMSGGVDSSVAAALLIEAGFDVVGLTMRLHDDGARAVSAARKVAGFLGIPHYEADLRRSFEKRIVAPFCSEYAAGRTPNPCVLCNRDIKFGLLGKKALSLGAAFLATGHYAVVEADVRGAFHLKKAGDAQKDQSYFLYTLGQEELKRTMFPLSGLTKGLVRKKAVSFGLPSADRPDSQEICFIPGDDYAAFLAKKLPSAFKPGPVVDSSGNVLGRHPGIAHYTVGQRKGLGISAPHPLYVISLDPVVNSVVVGRDADLMRRVLQAGGLTWVSGTAPSERFKCRARIRYRHGEAPAVVRLDADGRTCRVEFEEPQRAITPGQSVVFYRGLEVLGGGIIEAVTPGGGERRAPR